MATSNTPRIGLSKPDDNELMSQLDRDWNDPMDTLDAQAGSFTCTSGTRPLNPYLGQLIRETDTGKLLVWNGSAWIVYATKDAGWHYSGLTTLTPATGVTTTLTGWAIKEILNVTNGAGVVINTPGVYFASLNIRWEQRNQNTLGFTKGVYIDHVESGSSTVIESHNSITGANSSDADFDFFYMQVGGIFVCDQVGQKIEPKVHQASGGAYNLVALDSRFTGVLLQPLESY